MLEKRTQNSWTPKKQRARLVPPKRDRQRAEMRNTHIRYKRIQTANYVTTAPFSATLNLGDCCLVGTFSSHRNIDTTESNSSHQFSRLCTQYTIRCVPDKVQKEQTSPKINQVFYLLSPNISIQQLHHEAFEVQLWHFGLHGHNTMQANGSFVPGAGVDLHHSWEALKKLQPNGMTACQHTQPKKKGLKITIQVCWLASPFN